jgi:multiple sugar transport system substrate-binding protein
MYQGDAFADQKAAMAIVGPWAIAVYGSKVDWGVAPVPTQEGKDPSQIQTFSDEKSIGMYSSCQNRGTAWDFLKFATSQDNDGKLLEVTGQMPMREDLPSLYGDYFQQHPDYKTFAEQASRTVEVPNVPNSVEIWQTFRDAYTQAVIFGRSDVKAAFDQAAGKVKTLASGS